MELKNCPTLEKVKWREIKKEVRQAKPEFADVIDEFNPPNDLPLYKARYPFGSTIIKAGKFHLPFQNHLLPIDDPRIPEELRAQLGYNAGSIPMGIVLNHTAELFMHPENRIIPFGVMRKGKIFALTRALSHLISYTIPKVWHMTAGSRCVFMLPKITDSFLYKKLCRTRGVKLPIPRSLLEHGPIMTQISQHKDFNSPWYAELLFFPASWLTPRKDKGWITFHHYLYEDVWESHEYWQNKVVYDYIWDSFIKELSEQKSRINPHIIDIVKHLIMVGLGVLPGFCPAVDDEQAPIETLKHDFINCYELERFTPTIMVPKHFSQKDKRPVYWSLQLPSYLASSPKPRTPNSILTDLREVYGLLNDFYSAILEGKLEAIIDTPLHYLVKNVRYDFFHSEPDPEGIVRPCKEIPEEDDTFLKSPTKLARRSFSEISPFTRGCVRISMTSSKV